jgi:hypothetical protein
MTLVASKKLASAVQVNVVASRVLIRTLILNRFDDV